MSALKIDINIVSIIMHYVVESLSHLGRYHFPYADIDCSVGDIDGKDTFTLILKINDFSFYRSVKTVDY